MASDKARSLFLQGFYAERAQYAQHHSQDIRAGGKATRANPDKEDELWWLSAGPEMVQRWMDWRTSSDWKIWRTPQDQPAIELELQPTWAGVPVRMFVDRVFVLPTGVLVVVDLKSGARSPQSDLQLAWYACGIKSVYNVDVSYGAYWDARKGLMSDISTLTNITVGLVEVWVSKFVQAKTHEIYLPNLSHFCRACGVNRYCAAFGGARASVDPDYVISNITKEETDDDTTRGLECPDNDQARADDERPG